MAGLIILLLIIVVLCIVLPFAAMAKAAGAARAVEDLNQKVRDLQAQIFSLRSIREGLREPVSPMPFSARHTRSIPPFRDGGS